ncbi:globin domain-containing protein [Saccharicrinis aurantiacus]|uniref:globin domain-containing protein n=1 Tax=Saccharicrinis aurantiacus TaxID=1849719 RepID=UPI0009FA3FC0|nr:hypothetical protein [Saccharicrinis aurantiacus]
MINIDKFKISEIPFGERRTTFKPNVELYNYLGEDGFRKIIGSHYDLLVKSEIKDIFPTSDEELDGAKKRSADFFIQRFGGPEYYKMTRGNPMLANRHLPFKIKPSGRKVWLDCYRQVLSQVNDVPENLIMDFWNWLDEFSNWMVNTPEEPKFKLGFSLK